MQHSQVTSEAGSEGKRCGPQGPPWHMPCTTVLLEAHCPLATSDRPTEKGCLPEGPMAKQCDSLWGFFKKTVPSSVHLPAPGTQARPYRTESGRARAASRPPSPASWPRPPSHLQMWGVASWEQVGSGCRGPLEMPLPSAEPCRLLDLVLISGR